MSRIDRKKWIKDKYYTGTNGPMDIGDAIGQSYSIAFRITYDESLDLMMAVTPQEGDLIEKMDTTFSEKREVIKILNKYIDYSINPTK